MKKSKALQILAANNISVVDGKIHKNCKALAIQVLANKAVFISDMGESITVTDSDGKQMTKLPRYAAWGEKGKGRPEVLECSDSLEDLMSKYGLEKDKVLKVK